ncbi:Ig-like domain-containing protein [Brevibacillus sp. SYSU BS000544]|uniref:Ig-like domain-containing protein n=1 Tax=Brevibacillus sp. SYSU BS000544 TaxID=3416443 RepID=UPI003CE5952B
MSFKKAWKIVFMMAMFLFSAITSEYAHAAGTISIGSYMQLGSYNGEPIIWKVIHTDSNGYLLLSNKILSIKPFDAYGDASENRADEDGNRLVYGSNFWKTSNLREWLNSSDSTVGFTHQVPDDAHVTDGFNNYESESGFLADGNFTALERSVIQPITHKVILSITDEAVKNGGTEAHASDLILSVDDIKNADTAYYQDVTDLVFVPSLKEIQQYVYEREWNHRAYPTAQAVLKSEYSSSDLQSEKTWEYWLRDSNADTANKVRSVSGDGNISSTNAVANTIGVRPALYLKSDVDVAGFGDIEKPFVLDQGPNLTLADSNADHYASYVWGRSSFSISGKVWDINGDDVTVSAAIGGITKSVTVASAPTSVPTENNFTLTWSADDGTNSLPPGEYINIPFLAKDSHDEVDFALYSGKILVEFTQPTQPTIQFTSPVGYTSGYPTNQDVTFTINGGTDAESGVSHYEYRLSNDMITWGAWTKLTDPVTITGMGLTFIQAVTVDKAGNQSNLENGSVFKTNPPVIKFTSPATQIVSNKEGNKTFTISGKVWDIDNDYVTVKGKFGSVGKSTGMMHAPTAEPETDNFTFTWNLETDAIPDGVYDAIDLDVNNGKSKERYPGKIIIDTTAPSLPAIQFTSPIGYTSGTATTQNVTFQINNGTDATSGVLKSQYRTKENSGEWGAWTDYAAPITITAIGTTQIEAKTFDNVGNESAQASAQVVKKNPPPPTNQDIPVTGVSVDQGNLSLKVGDSSVGLTAFITPANATNKQVIWKSSNPAVATVDQSGYVKPVASGEATITVTTVSGNFMASCVVKVAEKEAKLTGLKVTEQQVRLKPNRIWKFSVFAVYEDGKEKEITYDKKTLYSSSSDTLAIVKPGSIRAGKKEGEAIVTVSFEGHSTTISVTVSKATVEELILTPASLSLQSNETKQVNLTAKLSNRSTVDVTKDAKWTSDDSSVITVDKGEVKAIAPGTATITATYGGKTVKLKVEVKENKKIKSISANKKKVTLVEGKQQEIKLTVTYQDHSKEVITDQAEWLSSNEQVVTVQNGVITAIASGTATVKAKYKGRSITIKVTVSK